MSAFTLLLGELSFTPAIAAALKEEDLDVVGESEGRLVAALAASGFEDVGDGAGAEGVAFESDGDGGGQLLRPVVVEQGEQSGGVRA